MTLKLVKIRLPVQAIRREVDDVISFCARKRKASFNATVYSAEEHSENKTNAYSLKQHLSFFLVFFMP